MRIRRAAPGDESRIAEMRRLLLQDEDGPTLDAELPAMLADPDYAIFVAEDEAA